jgi:hypothetical protein
MMSTSRARTWNARLFGRPGAATPPGIVALFVLLFGTGGGDALPAGAEEGRKVYASGVQADTLDASWRDVFPVTVTRLERDDWTVERADTAARQVVTRWKTMDHMLTRLALGDVLARCVVDLTPLADGRTVVRIRGGLASGDDLRSKPAWGAAQAAYRKAARKYLAGVRGEVERASATASGSPSGHTGLD